MMTKAQVRKVVLIKTQEICNMQQATLHLLTRRRRRWGAPIQKRCLPHRARSSARIVEGMLDMQGSHKDFVGAYDHMKIALVNPRKFGRTSHLANYNEAMHCYLHIPKMQRSPCPKQVALQTIKPYVQGPGTL